MLISIAVAPGPRYICSKDRERCQERFSSCERRSSGGLCFPFFLAKAVNKLRLRALLYLCWKTRVIGLCSFREQSRRIAWSSPSGTLGWARPPGSSSRRAGGSSSVLRLTTAEGRLGLLPCPKSSGHILGRLLAGPPGDAPRPFSSCSPAAPQEEHPVPGGMSFPFPAWDPPGDRAADRLVNFSKIAESLSSPCALADRE